jgi:hypothetical protein
MITGLEGQFTLPDRGPLSEEEWRWIELLRAAVGGSLPSLTLRTTQELQLLLREAKAR